MVIGSCHVTKRIVRIQTFNLTSLSLSLSYVYHEKLCVSTTDRAGAFILCFQECLKFL